MKLLLDITNEDVPYLYRLKPYLVGHEVKVRNTSAITVTELTYGFDAVITTNQKTLTMLGTKLFNANKVSIDNYAGSLFDAGGIEVLVVNPLKQSITVPYGEFVLSRYLSKLTHPEKWAAQTAFSWEVPTPDKFPLLLAEFAKAVFISIDIETNIETAHINICSWTAFWETPEGGFRSHSIVFKLEDNYSLEWYKKFNELPVPKLFQNGGFDNSYFLRYNIPPVNYLLDTFHLFHSWLAELPKALDFITPFAVRKVRYWKDDIRGTYEDYLRYCCRDSWATGNAMINLLLEVPQWAINNYVDEFSTLFPAILCGMEGFAIDEQRLLACRAEQEPIKNNGIQELQRMLGCEYNPNSPQQTQRLLKVFGCGDLGSSDEKSLNKAALRHPLIATLVGKIQTTREASKLVSTYLYPYLMKGKLLYILNPGGTETGRLASRKSNFSRRGIKANGKSEVDNCGFQIQNAPPYAKQYLMADDGWDLAEIDKSQSEARCVGYMSGDEALIANVESDRDYHGSNAELFFGIPYDQIINSVVEEFDEYSEEGEFLKHVREVVHNVLNKDLRDLSKRVNHGSNYNMGWAVLVETMGIPAVLKAQELLRLDMRWGLKQIAEYLLSTYSNAYPHVKGRWYEQIKYKIITDGMLVGPTGWTRKFFGDPSKSKRFLNQAVAHGPQNLSVMIINKEFKQVFVAQTMGSLKGLIRIKAQVHDSLVFQYRQGDYESVRKVRDMMQTRLDICGSDGVVRSMFIPVDVKLGAQHWSDLKSPKKLGIRL